MLADPLTPPVSGLVAGKYELVRLIGRGGMGSVWEGRHTSLGTRFAIKFIDAEYADSPEARARFDNEARAAATIESKHAIRIFDHGVTEDGRPYIVMELLVGEPLDRRIERLGRLSIAETARILQHVSRALQRAHASGIIHRDLKPENIFIVRSPDDDEEIAKVLDFGIAKIRGPAMQQQGVSSSTKTGAVLGTPYYMSPEQARGLRNIDHRSDVWSLGVIAYRCVVGQLPFEGESVGDLLVKICTAPLPVPSQVLPGLPPSFDAWFYRALERDPERRFESATALADALALTCGLSVRRGPQSSGAETAFAGTPVGLIPGADAAGMVGTPSPATAPRPPSPVPAAPSTGSQPVASGATPMPAALTSALVTSSSALPVKRASRFWIIAAALFGLFGGAVAVVAVVTYARKPAASPAPLREAPPLGGLTTPAMEAKVRGTGGGIEPTAETGEDATTTANATPNTATSSTATSTPTAPSTSTPTPNANATPTPNKATPRKPAPTPKPLPAKPPPPPKPTVNRDEPGF